MTDPRPSIAELRNELSRWPVNWKPVLGDEGEWLGSWSCESADGSADSISAEVDEDFADDFARLVATMRNAMPVLLDVVFAALEYIQSDDEDRANEIDALIAALDKVRP